MKSINSTYRIISLTMAFLIFFSSAGLTVNMHYCKGQLKTLSFLGKAKSCHEIGAGMKNCPHHKKMMEEKTSNGISADKKGCCSNKSLHFQADQDQQYQPNNAVVVNIQLQHFVIAFVENFLHSTFSKLDKPTFAHYKYPLISKDIYVLLESFLL